MNIQFRDEIFPGKWIGIDHRFYFFKGARLENEKSCPQWGIFQGAGGNELPFLNKILQIEHVFPNKRIPLCSGWVIHSYNVNTHYFSLNVCMVSGECSE